VVLWPLTLCSLVERYQLPQGRSEYDKNTILTMWSAAHSMYEYNESEKKIWEKTVMT
jgi:hypothetical protein